MSRYSELAKRLGEIAQCSTDGPAIREAAAALRELEAENRMYSESLANATQEIEGLREALGDFVFHYDGFQDIDGNPCPVLEKARAALEGKG